MPRGASRKREREYEELKDRFKDEGRYKGREEEVAARIVNKQRAELGETKEAKKEDREHRSPDRNLPLPDFDKLTLDQLQAKIQDLSTAQLRKIRAYEQKHKNRKGLMELIDRRLDEK